MIFDEIRQNTTNYDWNFTKSKGFNNCYILLLRIALTTENIKFVQGELSLRLSLMLFPLLCCYEP